jgi:hypothetical protein
MKPVGSGINVWLNEQVLSLLGEEEGRSLIAQSAKYAPKRYEWLASQLIERDHAEVVEEWHRKKKEDAAQSRIADKRRQLSQWQARLAETNIESQKIWYMKCIAKCEKYLKERESE